MSPFLKQVFDTFISVLSLIISFPLMILIGIAVRIGSRGPVIFRQKRVGQRGRMFFIYKFRTMYHGIPKQPISVKGDPGITPIGAFLRKWKLDELPELWNVLIGDMSLVGPRPLVPRLSERLINEEKRILQVKPGMTGPASLKYINEEEILAGVDDPAKYNSEVIFPDKVKINLEYLDHWTFRKDIMIIWYTLIRKRS
jgi:lipopolysaccharide/colanic/teichoic acid biosynthesis glycosyltransferase